MLAGISYFVPASISSPWISLTSLSENVIWNLKIVRDKQIENEIVEFWIVNLFSQLVYARGFSIYRPQLTSFTQRWHTFRTFCSTMTTTAKRRESMLQKRWKNVETWWWWKKSWKKCQNALGQHFGVTFAKRKGKKRTKKRMEEKVCCVSKEILEIS